MPGNLNTPSLQEISQWPTPQYSNSPEQRSWLGAFALTWQILSSIFVLGRLYLRIDKRSGAGAFGLDDGCILVAWILAILLTATACISDWRYRLGRHIWNVEPQHFAPITKMGWLAQILVTLSLLFVRCSVFLGYWRVAKVTYSKVWTYSVWALLFATAGSSIGIFVAYCFICRPLHYYWDFLEMASNGKTGQCIDGNSIIIATGVLTIVPDLWTAAFPCALFYFHDNGVTRRQKVLLNCLFCAGFLVTGVAIARTYFLWKVGHNQDISWYGYDLYVSSVVEVQLAMICICLSFVRSFSRAYFPHRTTATHHTGNASQRDRPTTDWTAISRQGEEDPTLYYELDDRGKVVPKYATTPSVGVTLSHGEQDESRRTSEQFRRSDCTDQKVSRETCSISSMTDGGEEAGILGGGRHRKAPVEAEHDEDWTRSRVREWVAKRPVTTTSVV